MCFTNAKEVIVAYTFIELHVSAYEGHQGMPRIKIRVMWIECSRVSTTAKSERGGTACTLHKVNAKQEKYKQH